MNNRHCSTKFDSNDKGAIYLFLIKSMDSAELAELFLMNFSKSIYPDILKFYKAYDVRKNFKRERYIRNVKNTERQELRK